MADDGLFIGVGGSTRQILNLKRANRHGLIAGATGTGKTVTLQGIVEGFSAIGVPSFVADVKGDLSGMAMAGSPQTKTHEILPRVPKKSVKTIGLTAIIQCNSGICSANKAIRSAPRFLKWGRCCLRG